MRHGDAPDARCTIHGPSMDPFPALGRLTRPRPGIVRRTNAMPKVAGSVKELLAALDGIVRIDGERLAITDEFRPPDARHLRPRLDRHFQRG